MIKARAVISRSILKLPLFNFSETFGKLNQILKSGTGANLKSRENFRYVDGELVPISNIVLHQRDNIEQYVFKIIKDYHRTTYKSGLTLESKLEDHGIDSLDAIELAMQIEEDLGYRISAENLSVFHKVKHFVTFIEQVENFKKQYSKNPLP